MQSGSANFVGSPHGAPVTFGQAQALFGAGELRQAGAVCEQLLEVQPNHDEALVLLGVVALQSDEPRRALECVEKALAINPRSAWAHNIYGNALLELGQPDAAIRSFDSAIALTPAYADAYYNRGNALLDLQRCEAAIADYDRAIGVRPEFAKAHANRGIALATSGQLEAAVASFERALAAEPGNAEAHHGRGRALHDLRRLQEAVASYSSAIALRPDYAVAYLDRAFALLTAGDLEHGWADLEWRRRVGGGELAADRRELQRPLWSGEQSIAKKVIVLCAEQGFGDTLQFCRYVKQVADLGATVILEAQPQLVPLLASLEGASLVLARGGPLPEHDLQCALMSLPRAFNTTVDTIPAPVGYLRGSKAKIAEWRTRLGPRTGLRIGLAWSGNVAHEADASDASGRRRSIPLAQLMAHLPDGCEYFCLQPEVLESDRAALEAYAGPLRTSPDLDFCSTAALCECMDLVISVDTSIAHLSGALGVPTLILLPFNCDWRWLLDRADSPWYPTARLYRHQRAGDWSDVLVRVSRDVGRLRVHGSD